VSDGAPSHSVLVVEDDPGIRHFIVSALEEQGYAVAAAADGAEAIARLRTSPTADCFCLVLLDMAMPVTDGLGVLQYLAQQELAIPVIAMSADSPLLRQARTHGAREGLAKPFGIDHLLAAVERNCQHARRDSEPAG
jgi:CheY-like chemotaxis protein